MDTVRVLSSEYAALSSVRPIKLKSMTPFSGCSNRQALDTGVGVVGESVVVAGVVDVSVVVVEVVPKRRSS